MIKYLLPCLFIFREHSRFRFLVLFLLFIFWDTETIIQIDITWQYINIYDAALPHCVAFLHSNMLHCPTLQYIALQYYVILFRITLPEIKSNWTIQCKKVHYSGTWSRASQRAKLFLQGLCHIPTCNGVYMFLILPRILLAS